MQNDSETTIQALKEKVARFNEERDWKQFHSPKDVAMDVSVEAGELLELFLWKPYSAEDVKKDARQYQKVREELADVLFASLNLANVLDIDVAKALEEKIAHNAQKYPVDKAKGKAGKYDVL